jgi:peptidoglycan/LPS O-acetylase OafA/YrhL
MNADKSDSSLVDAVNRGGESLSVLGLKDFPGSISIAERDSITAPRCPRYRSLDAWRGIACLLVIVAHSSNYGVPDEPWVLSSLTYWLWATCHRFWIGVPIFFVISGYCISATADATRRKGRPATDYFLRRFRRIFPPFWVWFLFSALVVGLSNLWSPTFLQDGNVGIASLQTLSIWQILGNLTLTESWRPWVVGDQTRFFLGHT